MADLRQDPRDARCRLQDEPSGKARRRAKGAISHPAMRYHGGKFRLAPWLLQFFPPHRVYTESFGGAASVLLRKPRSHAEVYNDLDGDVVAFFQCLRDPALSARLVQAIALTPYARAEFERAWQPTDDPVEKARRVAIRAQMGFGSAGATQGNTGFRLGTLRSYTTPQIDWMNYPDWLLDVAVRLRGVVIENRPALDVMRQHDTPDTLHFVDPPYVLDTRCARARGNYRHEMDDADHEELLTHLNSLRGMVVVSGYQHGIYASGLSGWKSFQRPSMAAGQKGAVMRTETVWINPACGAALAGHELFIQAPGDAGAAEQGAAEQSGGRHG